MKKMTHHFVVMLCCIGGALPGWLAAQTTTGLKIGVIDARVLISASPQAKALQKKLEEEFGPKQREMLAKQNELKDREAKLQKDAAVMGADERRNAEEKLRNDERDFVRRQNEIAEDAKLRQNDELGKLQQEVLKAVDAFARLRGYDLILGDGVLYATESINVTKQILDELNAGTRGAAPATKAPAPATKAPAPTPAPVKK